MEPTIRRITGADGAPLIVREWKPAERGELLTLLLLHFFGGSGETWNETAIDLAKRGYRCLAPDLRGFGDSIPWDKTDTFSFAAHQSDVRILCGLLAQEPFVLVGHSMSGKIALSLAAEGQTNLVGLILIAPSPPTPEPMPNAERARLLAGAGDRAAAEQTLKQITAHPLPEDLKARFIRDSVRVHPQAWRDWLERGSRIDISSTLAPVTVPSLVLVGAEDTGMTEPLMRSTVLPHLSQGTLEIISDAAHLIPLEQPETLVKCIIDWVKCCHEEGYAGATPAYPD